MKNWTFEKLDVNLAVALQSQLPPAVFDVHAHLWRQSDLAAPAAGGLWAEGPAEAGTAAWRCHIGRQVGSSRLAGGLLIPNPLVGDAVAQANAFVFEQIAGDPTLKGLALVTPQSALDAYRPLLDNPQFAGFKPYHVFSDSTPTFQASIASYLPEWVWHTAHEHGLVITLHLVRDAALADPENQRQIRQCCAKYPNARLILAHAGRGFHALNTARGVAALGGLDNVWCG